METTKVGKRKVETGKSSKLDEWVSKSPIEKNNSEDFFLSYNPADFGLSEKQGIFAVNVSAGKNLSRRTGLLTTKGKETQPTRTLREC
ncbi:hypothetical protein ACVUJJ_000507 [Cronobacter turicensis]|nr:hypothetical protein [Cronobacter turicensis]